MCHSNPANFQIAPTETNNLQGNIDSALLAPEEKKSSVLNWLSIPILFPLNFEKYI